MASTLQVFQFNCVDIWYSSSNSQVGQVCEWNPYKTESFQTFQLKQWCQRQWWDWGTIQHEILYGCPATCEVWELQETKMSFLCTEEKQMNISPQDQCMLNVSWHFLFWGVGLWTNCVGLTSTRGFNRMSKSLRWVISEHQFASQEDTSHL